MDVKWFFVVVGIFLTFAILSGMYFIGTFISTQSHQEAEQQQKAANERFAQSMNQSKAQFQAQINKSESNFNRSVFIHENIFNNITDLKKGLDPILAVIPNATQAELDRQIHYNQTAEDFQKIQQVLTIKLQDHGTLLQVNSTIAKILGLLHGNNTNDVVIDNQTKKNDTGVIIENITGIK
jgi:Na+-transporting methylmalonyl-CoA/oxaloacetate decarboxylase gamma subunit